MFDDPTVPEIAAALAEGIDLESIEHNLALTPKQRLAQHDAALALVMELRAASQRLYGKPTDPTPTTR
jgi:hypothetical protein